MYNAIKQAKCFDYESLSHYCPWCGMKLKGDQHYDGHVFDGEAWDRYGCDYSVGSVSVYGNYSMPISTIQVIEWRMSEIDSWFSNLPKKKKSMKKDLAKYREQVEALK